VRAALVLVGVSLLVFVPSSVGAATAEVNILFSDYRPSQLDVLPGETVTWTNVSLRTHTVTSDSDLFDSGEVAGGETFARRFDTVGTYPYHCIIHPSITGEVDVRRVTLDSLPPAALPVGKPVEFSGRAADPRTEVGIQRLVGSTWSTVASVTPSADGSWKTALKVESTGDYRAISGEEVSEIRRLLVSAWKVMARPTKVGLNVTVTPSAPYARFLVEVQLHERFGWWPDARGRLDYVSSAEVHVKRPARVRVALVDKDGWTPLATSRVITLRSR
jgi:plastocyanin